MCALMFALSGFLALSFEIVWFRLLGVMLKSTNLTFGTLLAIYLFGLGAGAALGSAVAKRIGRPGPVFAGLVLAAGTWAALSITLLAARLNSGRYSRGCLRPTPAPKTSTSMRPYKDCRPCWRAGLVAPRMRRHGRGFHQSVFRPADAACWPRTVLMGCSFPIVQKLAQTDLDYVGRRVGIRWPRTSQGAQSAHSLPAGSFSTGSAPPERCGFWLS